MNIKKQDLIILQQGLKKVADLFGDNVRFAYAIAKNDRLITPEVEAINKTIQPSKEFSDYDEKRIEFVKGFAKKDDKGEPLSENGSFILENKEQFEKAFEEFKKPYAEVLARRDEQVKEYTELLKEDTDVKLFMVNENDLPRMITPMQLAGIISIVE